jgi:hypothetical protein
MSRLMGRLRKLERVVARQPQDGPPSQGLSEEEMAGRLRAFAERITARERLGLPLEPEDRERCRKLQDLMERVRQRLRREAGDVRPEAAEVEATIPVQGQARKTPLI